MPKLPALFSVALALLSPGAFAQWNPPTGLWGKQVASDVRIMTWNVQDGICSTNAKVEGANNWCAIARIIAAMKPDVLILQETGDNSGNGTGSGVDSIAELTTTLGYLFHGGTDSFNGNTAITSYVQKYAASYDLTHVFVSSSSDGFNRNVILSRWAFQDLNGDTKATMSDIPPVTASQWAPGGDGGIRGFMFAEINLPDGTYPGNLVMGCAHLKSGGNTSDHTERILAAENVSYVMRYWYNGNGGSIPDPLGKIADSPAAGNVLDGQTPIVIGGDWNEDEFTNGVKGPAEWLAQAQTAGGTSDGTDHDGTDATYDHALQYFSGSDNTQSSGKFDYLCYQDSILTMRMSTIFISGSNPAAAQPPELAGYPNPSGASATASDHRPVVADFYYPAPDCNANGVPDATDIALGTSHDFNANGVPDECECFEQNYCTALPNSTGVATGITSGGSLSVASNTFFLEGYNGPPNVNGMFLASQNTQQILFGNGYLCVKSPIYRLGVVSLDFLGNVHKPLNFNALPSGMTIDGGETWHFQLWHRDTAAGGALVNTSDGRRVAFCP